MTPLKHHPGGKIHHAGGVPKHPALTTSVHIKVRNNLRHFENVTGAKIELAGTSPAGAVAVTATTNIHGVATLQLPNLLSGQQTLRVTPVDSTKDPVGPAIASTGPVPARI